MDFSDIPNFEIELDLCSQADQLEKEYQLSQQQSTQQSQDSARFAPVQSEHEFKAIIAARIPKNTQQSSNWAHNIYREWRTWRNGHSKSHLDSNWPVPALTTEKLDLLDYWLARFVTEIRKQDHQDYPPGTLTNIAAAIQRYMRDVLGRSDIWLLKKDHANFKMFRDALDARRKVLIAQGVGSQTNQADPISIEDEAELWESGIIGFHSAQALSYACYYYNCKIFGFRARDEHANLMVEQFCIGKERDGSEFLQFNGRLAKTVTGKVNSKCTPRVVKHYAQPHNERCVIKLFRKYFQLVPPVGRFYRRPLANVNGQIVFSVQHVGVNKLSQYMHNMFQAAGIDMEGKNITGHSGKVTCATTLYDHQFDEQAITSRSGHRSNAVRLYKRPSLELEKRISDSLQPPPPKANRNQSSTPLSTPTHHLNERPNTNASIAPMTHTPPLSYTDTHVTHTNTPSTHAARSISQTPTLSNIRKDDTQLQTPPTQQHPLMQVAPYAPNTTPQSMSTQANHPTTHASSPPNTVSPAQGTIDLASLIDRKMFTVVVPSDVFQVAIIKDGKKVVVQI